MPDGNLITITDAGGRWDNDDNDIKIVFSGDTRPYLTDENGATIDDNDRIQRNNNGEWFYRGQVNGGSDSVRYFGARKRSISQYPLMASVNNGTPEEGRRFGFVPWEHVPGESRTDPDPEPDPGPKPNDGGGEADGGGTSGPDGEDEARSVAANLDITIDEVVRVEKARDLAFENNTLYLVEDAIDADAFIGARRCHDVAVVGGGRLVVPAHDTAYDVRVKERAKNVLWSVDIDQRKRGAYGRIALPGDNTHLRDFDFIGDAVEPNYDPDDPHGRQQVPPAMYMPARGPEANTHIHNVFIRHEGTIETEHWGAGPIVIWLAGQHTGTLTISDLTMVDIPSDGIYCTNTTGRVDCRRVKARNCATAAIRIAAGDIIDCDVSFDDENTTLENTYGNNANAGIMVESKRGESGVTVTDTRVVLESVKKSPGALTVRNMTTPGVVTLVDGCQFVVNDAMFGDVHSPAVHVQDRGAVLERIVNSRFEGTADSGAWIRNRSHPIDSQDNRFGDGRKNADGSVNWDA